MTRIAALDIGGTHARFAIAEVAGGRVVALGEPTTFRTGDHATLADSWAAFGGTLSATLPRAAAIAIAAPTVGDTIRLTNNPWDIRPGDIAAELGLDRHILINDFGAVGHAVAQLGPDWFSPLCGPVDPLPASGPITICGPGTGLGVALLVRTPHGDHVVETEGGHIAFAPVDEIDEAILADLRADHPRISTERICGGAGIAAIYRTLAKRAGAAVPLPDDKAVWTLAMDGGDPLASAALERFCMSLGSIAGDLALAHGARGVVIAGGLGFRLRDVIARSDFAARFTAKGRFRSLMETIPVKLLTHPQPGLFGAAAAYAKDHAR